tara:strand:+ start:68 stop:379 length:312 start_codon:yes stop_codon:yes gene_type:complete
MDNKPNFEDLNNLINNLEIKEAIKNGDMGLINLYLKKIGNMVQALTALHAEHNKDQEQMINNSMKQNETSIKALKCTQEMFAKLSNSISQLSERVNVLEEAKK